MKTLLISAFPGCGKSTFKNNFERGDYDELNINKPVLDSDSSNFSWITINGIKTRNPNFPKVYIDHIMANIGKSSIIFISSHDTVRDALNQNNIEYYLVYPNKKLKDEWIERLRKRGSGEAFCSLIYNNWDNFIDGIENESKNKNCHLIRLDTIDSGIDNYLIYKLLNK